MAFLSITQGQTRFSGLLAKKKKVSTLIFMPVTRWYPQESPFPEQGEEVRGLEKVAAADVVELELSPGRQSPGPCLRVPISISENHPCSASGHLPEPFLRLLLSHPCLQP